MNRSERQRPFDTSNFERKWATVYRPTRPEQMLERAFHDLGLARMWVRNMQHLLVDQEAIIALNGSFVTGFCANPTAPYYGAPIDIGRLSDLDIALIDRTLFQHLPPSQVIRKEGLIDRCLIGQVSHGFVSSKDHQLKSVTEKPYFRELAMLIRNIMFNSGRFFDVKIFNGRSTLKPCNRPFFVLADTKKLYF